MPSKPAHRPRRAQPSPFARWVDGCGLTAVEIAARLGMTVGYLYNLRAGAYVPGLDNAIAIEKLSGGAVPVESWAKWKRGAS